MKKFALLAFAFILFACNDPVVDPDAEFNATRFSEVNDAVPAASLIQFVVQNHGVSDATGLVYCSKSDVMSNGSYVKLDIDPLKYYFATPLTLDTLNIIYFLATPVNDSVFNAVAVSNKNDSVKFVAKKKLVNVTF